MYYTCALRITLTLPVIMNNMTGNSNVHNHHHQKQQYMIETMISLSRHRRNNKALSQPLIVIERQQNVSRWEVA